MLEIFNKKCRFLLIFWKLAIHDAEKFNSTYYLYINQNDSDIRKKDRKK